MGMNIKNIITTQNGIDDNEVLTAIIREFPYLKVKLFHSNMDGIVGQLDEQLPQTYSDSPEQWAIFNVSNEEELLDKLFSFDDSVIAFSKLFPDRKFAYIYVDCFGGVCTYDGLVAQDGEVIFRQPYKDGGHITLLQQLQPDYKEYYFAPFTRDFFTKKGSITGRIKDFTVAGLWAVLNTDYTDQTKYLVTATAYHTGIRRLPDEYYIGFDVQEGHSIKVAGSIYNDTPGMIQEIEDIINNSLYFIDHDITVTVGAVDKRYVSG